jgi:hypothetical protein
MNAILVRAMPYEPELRRPPNPCSRELDIEASFLNTSLKESRLPQWLPA